MKLPSVSITLMFIKGARNVVWPKVPLGTLVSSGISQYELQSSMAKIKLFLNYYIQIQRLLRVTAILMSIYDGILFLKFLIFFFILVKLVPGLKILVSNKWWSSWRIISFSPVLIESLHWGCGCSMLPLVSRCMWSWWEADSFHLTGDQWRHQVSLSGSRVYLSAQCRSLIKMPEAHGTQVGFTGATLYMHWLLDCDGNFCMYEFKLLLSRQMNEIASS